jgi:hypothetical protein
MTAIAPDADCPEHGHTNGERRDNDTLKMHRRPLLEGSPRGGG